MSTGLFSPPPRESSSFALPASGGPWLETESLPSLPPLSHRIFICDCVLTSHQHGMRPASPVHPTHHLYKDAPLRSHTVGLGSGLGLRPLCKPLSFLLSFNSSPTSSISECKLLTTPKGCPPEVQVELYQGDCYYQAEGKQFLLDACLHYRSLTIQLPRAGQSPTRGNHLQPQSGFCSLPWLSDYNAASKYTT